MLEEINYPAKEKNKNISERFKPTHATAFERLTKCR